MSVSGSQFPAQVRVTADDLQREHREMARQLLRRTLLLGQGGPEDPDIAQNAGNGTITIRGGGRRLLTDGGHLIVIDTSIDSITIPSAEIPSPVFVVALVYEETLGSPGPHAVDGIAQNRASTASTRAVVYSASQYSALPETTTDSAGRTTYGQVAKDRLAIVAYAEIDSTGTLQLTTPSALSATLTAVRTENSGSAGTMTGIELVRFSATTSLSDPFPEAGTFDYGLLKLTIAGTGSTANVYYNAPQDGGGYGATSGDLLLAPTADGTEITLISADTNLTLTIRVYPSLFPKTDGDYIDDLTVTDLYTGLKVGGGQDSAHRSLLGGGLPSSTNAHGQTLSDIARQIDEVRAVIFGDGMSDVGYAAVPQVRHNANDETNDVGTIGFALKREYVGNTSTGAVNVREYIDHRGRLVVTTNAAWDSNSALWIPDIDDGTSISSKRTYLGTGTTGATASDPLRCKVELRTGITVSTTWADSAWTRTVADYAVESASGQDALQLPNSQVSLGSGQLGTAANALRSRLLLPMSATTSRRTNLLESVDETPTDRSRSVLYRTKGNTTLSAGPTLVDAVERVQGAYWDGSVWQLNGVSTATRVIESQSGVALGWATGAGPIADAAWTRAWSWDPSSGLVVASDTEFTGTTTFTGNVDLDGTTTVNGSFVNPGNFSVGSLTVTGASPATPLADTIYLDSIVKGWAQITVTTGTTSPYAPTSVILGSNFNVELGNAGTGVRGTQTYRDVTATAVVISLVQPLTTPASICAVISGNVTTVANEDDNHVFYEVKHDAVNDELQIYCVSGAGTAIGVDQTNRNEGWGDHTNELAGHQLFVLILGD